MLSSATLCEMSSWKHVAETGVDANVIINAGVRSVRDIVSGDGLAAALQAYSTGVSRVMYLGIGVSVGASGATTITALAPRKVARCTAGHSTVPPSI